MSKVNSKRNKKMRKLVIVCALFALLLTVSTYAWFIGMQTVSVTSFNVDIATTEGLYLSMDGETWATTLDAANTDAYSGNANQWLTEEGEGLIPVSTVGDMDTTSSRMKIYEKGSLTAKDGGYRLLTSQVNNYSTKVEGGNEYIEGDGYVAFDLFIKNLSGDAYYEEDNVLNEEAIYLTYESAVTVGESGEENTGIENSVRVAFAQIGRVIATTEDTDVITGINCTGGDDVTGICRSATIWEPNDTAHVANAINWYETSCLARDKTKLDGFTYTEDSCGTVADGVANATYAISRAIEIKDYVDIYDGEEFNGFTASVVDYETYADAEDKSSYKLVDYDYFTDTTKLKTGSDRVEFMSLAPNSITKVRVYIYIEGQDIDNYDFASLGKQISVKFGFTKERYTGEDIDYEGPEITGGEELPGSEEDTNVDNG